MILREDSENYILITQHDHAYIAGELLSRFKKEFIAVEHFESFKFAVHQHDRAWIVPDSHPLLNDVTHKPFTFLDFPEKLRLYFYRLGIEQVNQANSYAALLCSMHYSSLASVSSSEVAVQFVEREKMRQNHLISKLRIPNTNLLNYQLKILKFCDDLSLYICMNQPGATKNQEVALFKKGFVDSEFFHENGETRIIASYKDRNTIKLNSNPFEGSFEVKVLLKRVPKKLVKDIGIADAYHAEPTTFFKVTITGPQSKNSHR
ncbi:hypothetical protein BCY91_13785 [Pelobium manganitolerans]|uniref:DUF3891 domain-containing protein n=1 Tax=Pelobium manganitolerans TaxID=1842495 RepID=A0A419SA69_9SPHI|nr:DUF3891 family protein [Pelobium manganitolerans]RKD19085.1 hypothetical protein BCY91_13785 [Pelobium manganitolerans]